MAIDPKQISIPQLPINLPMDLRNYLQALQDKVAAQDLDPTPPALVTGVELQAIYPGMVVSWNTTLKAHSYIVYRNTEGVFFTATPITQMQGNGNVSFFDVTQALGSVDLYYWVQGVNALGGLGPVSAMVTTANSQAPGPGLIPGTTDSSIWALGNPDSDMPLDFGTAFISEADMVNSVTFWATTEEDDDFVTTPFTSDYRFP